MIVTILAEPRSGSTNLTNWFYFNKNFTTLFIPSDPKSKWHKAVSPKEYKYTTEHLLIKEDYYHYKNFDELIGISDKVILLYRENIEELNKKIEIGEFTDFNIIKRITPQKGKIIAFDGGYFHCGMWPKKNNRYVININLQVHTDKTKLNIKKYLI